MPNHCGNRLVVVGNPKDLAAFGVAACKAKTPGESDEVLDVSQIVPEPAELADVCSGSMNIGGIKFNEWHQKVDANGDVICVGIDKKERARLVKKYGAANLYDWHCHTFGTKWGTYESNLVKTQGKLVYIYKTAWAPLSEEFLKLVSTKFPRLRFEMFYAERGMSFKGYAVAAKGEIIDSHSEKIPGKDFDKDGNYQRSDEYTELVDISG